MNDPRGSIWRKWDLHLHTPASGNDYGNQSITNETIIKKLKDSNISAVAITDHFVMDVDRIIDLQRIAGEDITVFPGIELRSELGGEESIHYIGIFPDRLDIQKLKDIWDGLKGKLDLTPTKIHERGGVRAITCNLEKTCEIIHSFGGIVTIHAGKKTNSIENIANSEYYKMIQKKKIVQNSVDIMEIGKPSDEKDYKNIIFKSIGFDLPLIICSDNHNINEYTLKASCWIKADQTFEGLKQVLYEPNERVFIGDEPEILKRVRNKKTKYISTVTYKKNPGSNLDEKWFENHESIPFNHELVAVIGNKGSGKSALSDAIGLLGNSKQQDNFSFLRKEKFCNPKGGNKAEHFTACLKWEDGFPQEMLLSTKIKTDTEVEMVSYIPQNYLEQICSGEVEGEEFNKELKAVIFSHVEEDEMLGCSSLEELITAKTNEKNAAIEIINKSIHKLNIDIIKLEGMLHPNYKQEIENKLKLKEAEKAGIEKPLEVKKPDASDPKKQKEIEEINNRIAIKQSEIESLTASITKLQTEKVDLAKRINNVNALLQKVVNFQQQFETFHTECDLLCSSLGIDFGKIAKLEINTVDIKTIKTTASTRLINVNKTLSEDNKDGLVCKLSQAKGELEKLKTELDLDNKKYQKYLKELQEWKKQCDAIEGKELAPEEGTIWYYKAILKKIGKSIPDELQELKAKRSAKVKDIYNKLDELKNEYELLYAKVKEFMKSAPFSGPDKSLLDFSVSIECKRFSEKFFDYIAQNKKGSFYGGEEGKGRLRAMLDVADFNTYEGLEIFIKSIASSLIKDKREDGGDEDRYVVEQLKKGGVDMVDFYDYLYCLEYLVPEYNLQWSGKKLHQLSPGERGLVLLIFYFFIDKKDIPLVIDQPEENLDNESIYKVLVSCIKEAKKRRQIIIVTHNPNLAVVCDAEQIIYSEIDKQNGNRITYTCGAIENPIINKKLIDVLEGTRPAFNNRDQKYYVERINYARPNN
jgi:ABC-type lipoprotein export system ATPase subunit